ncbi:hypothetical protein SDC9_169307 [bioreactor metagenome]|uniref:Uncharacterized protein n=1 Tax=bioreactor metagenome TaxID=1076179 RepID=A0A645G5K1_9ZZZZ
MTYNDGYAGKIWDDMSSGLDEIAKKYKNLISA